MCDILWLCRIETGMSTHALLLSTRSDVIRRVPPIHWRCEVCHLQSIKNPSIMQGMATLTKLIFERAQPKRLGAQVITGPMLATLASEYVRAINQGAVPTISTAWQVHDPPASS